MGSICKGVEALGKHPGSLQGDSWSNRKRGEASLLAITQDPHVEQGKPVERPVVLARKCDGGFQAQETHTQTSTGVRHRRQPTRGFRSADRGQGLDDASARREDVRGHEGAGHLDILTSKCTVLSWRIKGCVNTCTPKGHRSLGQQWECSCGLRLQKGATYRQAFHLPVPLLPVPHLRPSQSLSASLLLSLSLSVYLPPSWVTGAWEAAS